MKPLRNVPPDRPHITVTMTQPTTMIDLGTYEVSFNADHINSAADDPYHCLHIKLIYRDDDIKRRLLKALTKAVCALVRKIEALTMLGWQRLFPILFVGRVCNCIGWICIWIRICWI